MRIDGSKIGPGTRLRHEGGAAGRSLYAVKALDAASFRDWRHPLPGGERRGTTMARGSRAALIRDARVSVGRGLHA